MPRLPTSIRSSFEAGLRAGYGDDGALAQGPLLHVGDVDRFGAAQRVALARLGAKPSGGEVAQPAGGVLKAVSGRDRGDAPEVPRGAQAALVDGLLHDASQALQVVRGHFA